MKKFSLLFCISFGFLLSKAQVATDFTATDCNGNSHTLFDELNAGKVIVITWVMPCGECVAGALTAYNITQSFEADFPGRVKMYISDDYANTPCSSLNAWCTTYGLARAIKFSDSAIRMSDYGFSGMPKTVAIAPDRTVIFNENYTVDADSLQSVIETALTTTSVKSLPAFISTPSVYPNPAI
ncbi:MAG TPA: hypothetical protein VJ508_09690, partial [Saprospiraceae bacterium]|nr:hypothetical protein [Saprospiraceae bacterium]